MQYPSLLKIIAATNAEIIAHGWDMDTLHYGGINEQTENDIIKKTIDTLAQFFGHKINGWLSPARSQSINTAKLLVQNGITYMADWVNDDMPFTFKTEAGNLINLPLNYEIEDQFLLLNNQHSEASYAEQVIDAFHFLLQESETQGGRILALNIHPWMLGQPHRIKYLEQVLAHITNNEHVFVSSANELCNYVTV